jgi:serine/threonine protein kinase
VIELTPGARFGPYLVTRKLGRGGMGAVYAAEGPQGQEVALKLLDLSQADDEGIARFQREAESHARVDRHPNVARIHGSAVEGVQPYLVMDLLSGGDLASRLRSGPSPPRRSARSGSPSRAAWRTFTLGGCSTGISSRPTSSSTTRGVHG